MTCLCFNNNNKESALYSTWAQKINELNINMKSIQKVQNMCVLLEKVTNSPDLLNQSFDGHTFDKNMVYLPALNLISKFTEPLQAQANENKNKKKQFKIFLFSDEYNIPKKIRIMQIA
jgi:hypothetical protein